MTYLLIQWGNGRITAEITAQYFFDVEALGRLLDTAVGQASL